jgi:16S rRNA (guanine966-N2)-methyltransferase
MKDRTREALFNLLGPISRDQYVLDLFAGTGVMSLESLSRGAGEATLIEYHRPTAAVIRENIQSLGVEDRAHLIVADAFRWFRQAPPLPATPWLVFLCPPYDYYASRWRELQELLQRLIERAPMGSVLALEADTSFDPNHLPEAASWRVRDYPPARIALRISNHRPSRWYEEGP